MTSSIEVDSVKYFDAIFAHLVWRTVACEIVMLFWHNVDGGELHAEIQILFWHVQDGGELYTEVVILFWHI